MKRVVVAFIILIVLASILWVKEAECLGCLWQGDCYNHSICGSSCVCVKDDAIDVKGYCAVLP